MRAHAQLLTKVLLILIPATVAWTASRVPIDMDASSRLWVKGTSTVRGFECKADAFAAAIEPAGQGEVKGVLAGEKVIGRVEVTVNAAQLNCSNSTMNGHMLKAIKAKEHPTITFALDSYDLQAATGVTKATLHGTLTLGGVNKPVQIDAEATEGPNGTVRVVGQHEVMMSEYGLKAPTLMFGTMKVHDRVKVFFNLALRN